MSISFTAMQNALLANGMYEITEDTRLYAELKAYDAGFQTLHDQLDELLQEALIPTAVSYGLEEKDLVCISAPARKKKEENCYACVVPLM